LNEKLKVAVRSFFLGEKKDLLALLFSEKFEKAEYIALIIELIEYVKK